MNASPPDTRHRILVVDDDESSRDIVQRTLNREYDVLTAESGPEGLDILEREPIDLVLLDVLLPGERGVEVCRRVKTHPRGPYLPVILLTALNEQEDRNEGLAAGADDYLTKPFDRNELRLRVATFLRLREQDRTIRSQVEETRRLQALKDDLVSLIAHDLRNPLLGIQGSLDLMQLQVDTCDRATLGRRVENALTSTQELRTILDGLLDIRQLEDARFPIERVPTRLDEILKAVMASLEGASKSKAVTLVLEVTGDSTALVDIGLFRRAAANLLSNAIRHGPRASTVEARILGLDTEVRLEVADRGPGVPDELKGALFQKFGGVEGGGGTRHRGHGLGLYLVRLVAEAHAGWVRMSDREGGGSVFAISLPR